MFHFEKNTAKTIEKEIDGKDLRRKQNGPMRRSTAKKQTDKKVNM